MSESFPFRPPDAEPLRRPLPIDRLRDHYLGTSPIGNDAELRRTLSEWRGQQRHGTYWPETDHRVMARLYQRAQNVWEVLSSFSGSFRFPRNQDGQLSHLIPQAVWDDAKRAYGHYEREILALEANRPKDFDRQLEAYRREKIPNLLATFHAVADPYIVAEARLAARHADLFPRVLRTIFLDDRGEELTSEEDAVTTAKELIACLFPEELRQMQDEAVASKTQRLDPAERAIFADAYRRVFEEARVPKD